MGFTKLDEGILKSSIMAADPVVFKVWIVLMAACESDGVARVAPPFIAGICHMPVESVRDALEQLCRPDPDSRTPEHEGRRIERCDGGWRLYNYLKYRRLGIKEAESAARSDRRHQPRRPESSGHGPDSVGQSPGPSASASPSASVEEGGVGEGVSAAAPLPPARRAEEQTQGTIRSLQLKLGSQLALLAEHENSRLMVPDWCRKVTAYDYPTKEGPKHAKGVADYRTVMSIDRLEKSIADSEWWMEKLNSGRVVDGVRSA